MDKVIFEMLIFSVFFVRNQRSRGKFIETQALRDPKSTAPKSPRRRHSECTNSFIVLVLGLTTASPGCVLRPKMHRDRLVFDELTVPCSGRRGVSSIDWLFTGWANWPATSFLVCVLGWHPVWVLAFPTSSKDCDSWDR